MTTSLNERLSPGEARGFVTGRARENFGRWLAEVSPGWSWHWPHLKHVRDHLDALTAGTIDRLAVFLPPQHGKSQMVTVRYPVWRLERNPKLRVAVACYNQMHANRFSRRALRIAQARGLSLDPRRSAVEEWETAEGGGLRAVGVGAGITGSPVDLLIVDDPVKNREEADSEAYRERVKDWYADDLYTRLQPGAAVVLIQTRWHEDDLAGAILASPDADSWAVVNLPAEAEDDDPLGRAPGEALCPERFDLADLADRARVLGPASYSALYQQRPVPRGGGMIKASWFEVGPAPPTASTFVRYWDKAGTAGGGAYTAGVLMARSGGLFYVVDVVRGQWAASEREPVIRATAEGDRAGGRFVRVIVEQEPGSGGKESAESTIRNLAGFSVSADRPTGEKDVRLEPFAAQAAAGNVKLVAGPWVGAYLAELSAVPAGKYRDQADATAGAFNALAVGGAYHPLPAPRHPRPTVAGGPTGQFRPGPRFVRGGR